MFRPRSLVAALSLFILASMCAFAGDLRIPLPKRSKYTPVQALNRDGVKAVERHQYDRAKKLFYKAYLIDPNDPFTLNNLGYMAELEGDADRARRFYGLAAELGSDAVIDKANNQQLEGKPVSSVAGQAEDKGIKVNRLNNQAITLLQKDRAPEADLILQKALTVDPQNAFTLNNLGYAKEKEGEIDAAYQFYTAAANRGSDAKVEVALDKDWRGRGISDVARDNARKLNRRLRDGGDRENQVAMLNLRGVSALNRNDRRAGRDFIEKAFKLSPTDAFTLNNMGYLAELDGDRETAEFYYEQAREANQRNAKIAIATRKEVEGRKIGEVADLTDQTVEQRMADAQAARQRMGGPVQLKRRDNTAVIEPDKPVYEPPKQRVSNENGELQLPARPADTMVTQPSPSQPAGGLAMPLPDNEQPATVKEGDRDGGMIMPLPDDQQPGSQPNAQPQQKEGQHDGGMIMPLPDNQQPGTAPSQQNQPAIQEGPRNNGVMMPLPDNQQPGAQPTQPQTTQPTPQTAQPAAPPQAQTPAPQNQKPGLLLPLPDSQQPPNAVGSSPSATQSTTGATTSSPAPQSNGTTNQQPVQAAPPAPPKKISDMDQKKPAPTTTQPNGSAPKKITDQ
jgi:Flp pilus assembly protein TadD